MKETSQSSLLTSTSGFLNEGFKTDRSDTSNKENKPKGLEKIKNKRLPEIQNNNVLQIDMILPVDEINLRKLIKNDNTILLSKDELSRAVYTVFNSFPKLNIYINCLKEEKDLNASIDCFIKTPPKLIELRIITSDGVPLSTTERSLEKIILKNKRNQKNSTLNFIFNLFKKRQ